MRRGTSSIASALIALSISGCGGTSNGSDPVDDAADGDGGGGDAPQAPDGPPEPGWNAPFALDPAALGLTESVTWDFANTQISGPDPIHVAGMFENASNATAPVSGPGVGRALFTGETNDGATWSISSPSKRIYFRDMFALSDPYAASDGREAYFAPRLSVVGGGTLGQSTVDFAKAMVPTTEAEALAVPLRMSVGVLTPNGPTYLQTTGPELTRGAWHQLEAYFAVNAPGASDGVARVWLDGVLVVERSDIAWDKGLANSSEIEWSGIHWYDLRQPSYLAAGQHRDHDHLQVFWSTTR